MWYLNVQSYLTPIVQKLTTKRSLDCTSKKMLPFPLMWKLMIIGNQDFSSTEFLWGWPRKVRSFVEIDGYENFYTSQFLSRCSHEALSALHSRAFTAKICKNWQAKLLLSSNKAARLWQNYPRTFQHALLFSSPKVFLSVNDASMGGSCSDLLLRQMLLLRVGHGREQIRETHSSPPSAVALGGLWNSLGWSCWELTTFTFLFSLVCFQVFFIPFYRFSTPLFYIEPHLSSFPLSTAEGGK